MFIGAEHQEKEFAQHVASNGASRNFRCGKGYISAKTSNEMVITVIACEAIAGLIAILTTLRSVPDYTEAAVLLTISLIVITVIAYLCLRALGKEPAAKGGVSGQVDPPPYHAHDIV